MTRVVHYRIDLQLPPVTFRRMEGGRNSEAEAEAGVHCHFQCPCLDDTPKELVTILPIT